VMWALTVLVGLTMVSNVPFYSFKDINLKKSVPFAVPFVLVMAYVLIVSDPPRVLFGLFILYWLSGYVIFLWRWRKGRPVSILQTEVEVHDDH
jgi:CDP-diacylglycerol---serine O-phosphatidyltransferase